MAIMKEWSCFAHGDFESTTGRCPRGCSSRFVVQEFRTPPALKSGRTKRADQELDNLAKDYRLTNIKNGSDGESVMDALRRSSPEKFVPTWGHVDHAAPGFSARKEPAKTFNPASAGVQPTAVLKPGMMPPPKPLITHRHRDQQ